MTAQRGQKNANPLDCLSSREDVIGFVKALVADTEAKGDLKRDDELLASLIRRLFCG